ncbi:hypothetical protein HY251_10995, partial [bacterium]|nr:hypothetical protein [bacterium]
MAHKHDDPKDPSSPNLPDPFPKPERATPSPILLDGSPRAGVIAAVKRTAITLGVIVLVATCLLASAWHSVFHYVGPKKILIVKTKTGDDMPPGQLLAKPGQKGIQEEVLGEGRHFILPIVNEVEEAAAVEIGAHEVGIVTANIGKELPPGKLLADPGERGVQRQVLAPGRYRLNPHGYKVQKAPATIIRPGYVGFVTALVGRDRPQDSVLALEGEKGPRKDVLSPGIYYLNPRELKVEEVEVGINQVSFLEQHRLSFPSADAFPITLEATVEWELHPSAVPLVMKEFGARSAVEEKIIQPESKSIGRLAGSRYAAGQRRRGFPHPGKSLDRSSASRETEQCSGDSRSGHC